MMRRITLLATAFVLVWALGGCPPEPGGDGTGDPNMMSNGGGSQDGGDNGGDDGSGDDGGGDNGGGGDGGGDDGGTDSGDLFLRQLTIDERAGVLTLNGSFGDTAGDVFVNDSLRALAGGGWQAGQIEVQINRQDLGEVYVQVGSQVSNTRRITGWDFVVRHTDVRRLKSVCSDCLAEMTWSFRIRGDVEPVDFGGGQVSDGGFGGSAVAGATYSLDSVTGSWNLSGEDFTLASRDTMPAHLNETSGSFSTGAGEWFSANAVIDPAAGEAIVNLHIDTDGTLLTNVTTGDTFVERITAGLGNSLNRTHPDTLIMSLSPSLNIPAGSQGPDSVGNTWEWDAAPVKK